MTTDCTESSTIYGTYKRKYTYWENTPAGHLYTRSMSVYVVYNTLAQNKNVNIAWAKVMRLYIQKVFSFPSRSCASTPFWCHSEVVPRWDNYKLSRLKFWLPHDSQRWSRYVIISGKPTISTTQRTRLCKPFIYMNLHTALQIMRQMLKGYTATHCCV